MFEIIYPDNKEFDKQIRRLAKADAKRCFEAIEKKLKIDPVRFGKPLKSNLAGVRSLRVGSYRVLFQIRGAQIFIATICHRKDVYEG